MAESVDQSPPKLVIGPQDIPEIQNKFSYKNFNQYIINSSENFSNVIELIQNAEAGGLEIRFNIWRVLLGMFSPEDTIQDKKGKLDDSRQFYYSQAEKFKYNPEAIQQDAKKLSKPNPLAKNPLAGPLSKNPLSSTSSGASQTPLNEDLELRNEIKKDVERTYQEYPLFVTEKIQNLLINLLFVWSKMNPIISYRQGINQVVAPLLNIYFREIMYMEKQVPSQEYDEEEFVLQAAKFQFYDAMKLWDAIFLYFFENPEDKDLHFLDCTSMAMIRYVRTQIFLGQDMTDCLGALQKFPPVDNIQLIIKIALINKELLKNPTTKDLELNVEINNEIAIDIQQYYPLNPKKKIPGILLSTSPGIKQSDPILMPKSDPSIVPQQLDATSSVSNTNTNEVNQEQTSPTIVQEEQQKQLYTTSIISQQKPIEPKPDVYQKNTGINETQEMMNSINVYFTGKETQTIMDLITHSIIKLRDEQENDNIQDIIEGLKSVNDVFLTQFDLAVNPSTDSKHKKSNSVSLNKPAQNKGGFVIVKKV